MNGFRQRLAWLLSVAIAVLFVFPAAAQKATNSLPPSFSVPANMIPPPPPSPMDFFRSLLEMSPPQREAVLAHKTPAVRERILAKVTEYAALDPTECELRLRATELRWFLMPLLRAPPGQRTAQLALVPDSIRSLVRARLMEWQTLPPPLQEEFLKNEHILGYFSRVDATNSFTEAEEPTDAEQSHWNALTDRQRKGMTVQFNQFFSLSTLEKQQAIDALSNNERAQIEKTMLVFDKLPAPQRIECLVAFTKFANLSPGARVEFLRNAQRWSRMTATERKAWVDLVVHVPQWPPLPPALLMPPPPPPLPPNFHPVTVTNHS